MRQVRMLVALVAIAALVGVGAPPSSAAPGDDAEWFIQVHDITCEPGVFPFSAVFSDVPAGATYELWVSVDGRLVREAGPFAVPTWGTGTVELSVVSSFYPTYPITLSLQGRLLVDGLPVYQGGTLWSCSSSVASPSVGALHQDAPPCGPEGTPAFSDVPAGHPFCLDVAWASASQITFGYPDGGFHPLDPVTRQAMAAFLHRAAGAPPWFACVAPPFPDVPVGHQFCSQISWLVAVGITTGYDDGLFHPAAPVSRQAMAAFLYRFAGEPRGADPSCAVAAFPDVPASHPFCGEIDWLVDEGIATGYTDGGYHPAAPVSRQAMVAFLHREANR